MTKVIAFSDIHGHTRNLMKLVPILEKADAVLFLGDGLESLEILPETIHKKLFAVKGNCDPFSSFPNEVLVEIAGKKFFIAHGHKFGVKNNIKLLANTAKEAGADIALYGHAHKFNVAKQHDIPIVGVSPIGTNRTLEGGTYVEIILSGLEFIIQKKSV